jgi:ketosteroid isomerase-like protein
MKTKSLAITLVLASSTFLFAQAKSDTASKLLALEQKWTEAYQKGEISVLDNLLADDFIITVEDGSTYSKSGYVVHSGDPNVHVQIAEISDVKTRLHGNTAIITGAYHEKGTNKGAPYEYHDRFTDVWMNLNGEWRLVASHYSIPAKV